MSSVTCTLGGQTLSTLLQGVPNIYRHQGKTLADSSVQTNTPLGGTERYKAYGVLGAFDLRFKHQTNFDASVAEKLEMLQKVRNSLEFNLKYTDCDGNVLIDRRTVVFIDEMIEVLESDIIDATFYDLYLREAYRYMLSDCEDAGSDLGEWDNGETGNGTVSVETSIFKEGAGCIKNVDPTLVAMTYLELDIDFPELIDASPYNWVSFWYRFSYVTALAEWKMLIYCADHHGLLTGYYLIDLLAWFAARYGALPTADTWYYLRIPKTDFTRTVNGLWEQVGGVDIMQRWAGGPIDTTVYIDELGFIE